MSRKEAKLSITLKSDLCVGSGYSYAGIVDSDICYNENGIPYIPGRRLKGCLREAGELIGIENLAEVFGVAGNDKVQGIWIQNAYPEGYEHLDQELTAIRKGNSEYAAYLTQQKVLSNFTRIKAQTQIIKETGVAKENTLRYIRVVNQYSPIDGKEMRFSAVIKFDCDEEVMIRVVKALRHIGMDRNRGLGNVKCELKEIKKEKDKKVLEASEGDEWIRLEYVVRNTQALMMSNSSDTETERYISGQSVLGALAGKYLEAETKGAESQEFRELFLKGKARFENLYPCVPVIENGKISGYQRCEPAPLFLNRLKKTRKLVNLAARREEELIAEYNPNGGNQPKKLKTEFVVFRSGSEVDLTEPMVDIIYHHSKRQKSPDGSNGILYTSEVLREGQYFKGSIITERKYADLLKSLLQAGTLRFGKSRSAQYGTCELEGEIQEYPYEFAEELKKDERILVVFTSDAVFLGENGYTTRYEEVRHIVADHLGLKYKNEGEEKYSSIQTKVMNGYQTVWNMKKPSVPAIQSGSVIEYVAAEDCKVNSQWVGVKNLEGYGTIRIFHPDRMSYAVEQHITEKLTDEIVYSKEVLESILLVSLADKLKEKALECKMPGITAATLGRVTLMLKESLEKNRKDSKAALKNFNQRILDIKRDSEREKLKTFLDQCVDVEKEWIQGVEKIEEYKLLKKLGTPDWERKVKELWGIYLMQIFTYQKYNLKREGAKACGENNR